jgi:hypothetical protein
VTGIVVAPGWERDEGQAAGCRARQRRATGCRAPLPCRLLGRRRSVEAPDNVLVPGRHDPEHGGGQRDVHDVDGGEPVPGRVHHRWQRGGSVVKEPQAQLGSWRGGGDGEQKREGRSHEAGRGCRISSIAHGNRRNDESNTLAIVGEQEIREHAIL